MYKFDIYFAGSAHADFDTYLVEHGANRLLSQGYQKKDIERWLASNKDNKGKLLIDSGAYSVFKAGKTLDVDMYIDYLNANSHRFGYFIQADHLPGKFGRPATDQEKLESPKKSWDNYLYMVSKLKEPDKLLPVFHNGEDYKWLHNMLEYTRDGKHIPYICIAPMHNVNLAERDRFIEKCFQIIKASSNPNVKVHALGVTRLDILERYPFTSADSTSWIITAANGNILTKFGNICVSNQESAFDSCMTLPEVSLKALREYVMQFGYTLEELSEDYHKRALFNIKYQLDWAEHYTYKPVKWVHNSLFD